MDNERLQDWLDVKKPIVESLNKGDSKVRFAKGQLIRTPEDLDLIREHMIKSRQGKGIPGMNEVVSAVSRGVDLGTALSSLVMNFPNALRRRANGLTSVFRLYGRKGVGKSQSSMRVLDTLGKLHTIAVEGIKGNMSKEAAQQLIAKTAEYAFKPYAQFIGKGEKGIDWNKWAGDLMDGAEKYGSTEFAPKTEEQGKRLVEALNSITQVFGPNRSISVLTKEGAVKTMNALKHGVGSVAAVDDFMANTDTKSFEGNITQIVNAIGDPDFPPAVLVDTENPQTSVVEKMDKFWLGTEGGSDRTGIGFLVDPVTADKVVNVSKGQAGDMGSDALRATMLDKVNEALYGDNKVTKRKATKQLEEGMRLGGNQNPTRTLQDLKSTLEEFTGSEDKSKKLMKMLTEGMTNILKSGGDGYENVLKVTGEHNLLNSLLSAGAGHFADKEMLSPDKFGHMVQSIAESLHKIVFESGADYSGTQIKKLDDQHTNKEANAVLSEYFDDNLKDIFKGAAGDVDPEKVKEKLRQQVDEEAKQQDEMFQKSKKAVESLGEKLNGEVKKFGEGGAESQLLEEADWEHIATDKAKGLDRETFNFARVLENSKTCKVIRDSAAATAIAATKPEYMHLGRLGGAEVFVDKAELENSRTYSMWKDINDAAHKQLDEKDAKALMRDLIISAHGPSLASHALMTGLGLYEGGEASKESLPFFENFGKIVDDGVGMKEKYSDEDTSKAAKLLEGLADHADLKKLGSGEDAIMNELQSQMTNLINKDGSVNESVNKSLSGFEVLSDMLGRQFNDVVDKIAPSKRRNLDAFLNHLNVAARNKDLEMPDPEGLQKDALKNRRKDLCSDSGKMVEAAKTVNDVASHPTAELAKSVANERAKRLLTLGFDF